MCDTSISCTDFYSFFSADFYDNHDVWHIISSMALFFGFVTVLTLDDHLLDKPRNEIRVF